MKDLTIHHPHIPTPPCCSRAKYPSTLIAVGSGSALLLDPPHPPSPELRMADTAAASVLAMHAPNKATLLAVHPEDCI